MDTTTEISGAAVIAAAVCTVLAVLIPGIVSIIAAWRTEKKADEIIVKTDEIHSLANSQLTAVTASLAIANEKIIGLEKLLASIAESEKSIRVTSEETNGIVKHMPSRKKR